MCKFYYIKYNVLILYVLTRTHIKVVYIFFIFFEIVYTMIKMHIVVSDKLYIIIYEIIIISLLLLFIHQSFEILSNNKLYFIQIGSTIFFNLT